MPALQPPGVVLLPNPSATPSATYRTLTTG